MLSEDERERSEGMTWIDEATGRDFDKPHPYTKSYGDGSPRGYCRCGKAKDDPIHNVEASAYGTSKGD